MRAAIIEGQKGLEDFLNFVRDEGAVGSNPAIPINLYIAPTALLPWVACGKLATNPAIGAWEVFA